MNLGRSVKISDAKMVSVAMELVSMASPSNSAIQMWMKNPHESSSTPKPAATAELTNKVALPADRNARRIASLSGTPDCSYSRMR